MDQELQAQIRRLWCKDKIRTKCKQNARVSRGKYKCSNCGQLFGPKQVEIHHLVSIKNATDWNSFIDLLFCNITGLVCCCKHCHLHHYHNGSFK
jgi:5-methylcytosine-specific restriction endonuclease McrA